MTAYLDELLKHMQGKHPQKAHGPKGGGKVRAAKPKKISPKAQRQQDAADVANTLGGGYKVRERRRGAFAAIVPAGIGINNKPRKDVAAAMKKIGYKPTNREDSTGEPVWAKGGQKAILSQASDQGYFAIFGGSMGKTSRTKSSREVYNETKT